MDNFYISLGIGHYAEFFNELCDRWPEFRHQAIEGFSKYSEKNQPLTTTIRKCIVDLTLQKVCGDDRGLRIKLSALKPDLTVDTPWKLTGLSERELNLLETYLVSGSDPKKVAEKILENSNITPWRMNAARIGEQT